MSEQQPENTSSREERKEAKRGRRKFRHEIEKRMWKVACRRLGMFARPAQLHAEARILTDRYMHAVDHPVAQVKPLETTVIPAREAELVSNLNG